MSTATSSSDRYAEARAALAEYDELANQAGHGGAITSAVLAAALRVLIEPPATVETPNLSAVYSEAHRRALPNGNGPYTLADLGAAAGAAREAVYQADIQAAWETWEPDDYAPVPEPAVLLPHNPECAPDPLHPGYFYCSGPGAGFHVGSDDPTMQRIRAFLDLHEKNWPNNPQIDWRHSADAGTIGLFVADLRALVGR